MYLLRHAACNVYISEGQDQKIISHLQNIAVTAAAPSSLLANVFIDRPYNRTNFTLLSRQPESLVHAAVSLSTAALEAIDLRSHSATHPRLGVVDHISCHPVTSSPAHLDAAASVARSIGEQLGKNNLPSYLYGHANPQKSKLADIRRNLGYFSANQAGGIWKGPIENSSSINNDSVLPIVPDYGPTVANPRAGVCCVGAVPWLINLNVLIDSCDMRAVKEIARAVSERGGGIPGVQAMALQHEEGIEVACNLLTPEDVGPSFVEREVRKLAENHGLKVKDAYCTGKSIEDLLKIGEELGL